MFPGMMYDRCAGRSNEKKEGRKGCVDQAPGLGYILDRMPAFEFCFFLFVHLGVSLIL
jgi:hypothetical protein